ncbi:MAG: DNA-binding protein WhiA [Candidatus Eremiobacteraeota bacterium]|nr:DNA-binding protein WhiA [Candidatus Eremiobacteraeota bacterium]
MSSSLSADTKDALARDMPAASHCREALLAGLAFYGCDAAGKYFATHRNAVARLFRSLAMGQVGARLGRTAAYKIELPPALREIPRKPVHKCDRVMEARAAFLACGSLSAGARGYHIEFVLPAERATRLEWTLRAVGFPPKGMERKRRRVLYYKDFEAIVSFLTIAGAHGAVLHLEDIHALKDTKNRIHRLVNTEAANLERSAAAAAGHRQTIEYVASAYGLPNLSGALREIAELRLAHPDESLAEIGARANPPIGKSTVNSRLAALGRLARRVAAHPEASNRKPRGEPRP